MWCKKIIRNSVVGLYHVNTMAKLETHFSKSPSLYCYGFESTRREIYFEIWNTEVRQRPLQSDGRCFRLVKDRYRDTDGSQLIHAPGLLSQLPPTGSLGLQTLPPAHHQHCSSGTESDYYLRLSDKLRCVLLYQCFRRTDLRLLSNSLQWTITPPASPTIVEALVHVCKVTSVVSDSLWPSGL